MRKPIILENKRGMKVAFSPLGASLLDIVLKMKNGHMRNVTLRPKALADFASSKGYYGKTIGR
ncbi:MAG: galactose-1-epimerase, partial [Bacilli bacterium]|nr:galactose-1-epimerase [Bacilli bacterium]